MGALKRIKNSFKKQLHKLRYLDKTKSNYFLVTTFIALFCLFTGTTYSYFALSKNLNAATITIAKLNYNLTSSSEGYNENGSYIEVKPGTTFIDLTLSSLNKEKTKYALNYEGNTNIEVYYSKSLDYNMMGEIGPSGSEINMRVVIVNNSNNNETVKFKIQGGYLQNTLNSNITEGYYESDITIRAVLHDEAMTSSIIDQDFPSKASGYVYLDTWCTEDSAATWNTTDWKITINELNKRVACDVHFKKPTSDIEIYYVERLKDGTRSFKTSIPNDGSYVYTSSSCNNDATATWDNDSWKLNIQNLNSKTVCVAHFDKS